MVGNVVVGNVVQEEAAGPTEKRAVNGRDSAANKGPRILAEVGHGGVSVMQVSEHDNPVVREEVRDGVHLCDSCKVGNSYPVSDDAAHCNKTKVRQNDLLLLLFLEQCGIRRVMLHKSNELSNYFRKFARENDCSRWYS